MFEAKLAAVLQQYLGDYVHGLDKESLKISVWKGDVVLRNLRLKADALKFLGIAGLVVKAGLLGSLTIKVPWNKLGSEPVVVEFDRLYVLSTLDGSGKGNLTEDLDEAQTHERKAKERRIEAAVSEFRSTQGRGGDKGDESQNASGGGYWGNYIQMILGNLQISFTNLHVRIEDPTYGFSFDLTLQELSGITVDEHGKPAFVSSGFSERLRKSFKLRKLALYLDAQATPFHTDVPWESLDATGWDDLFMQHIDAADASVTQWFLIKPIDADLLYERQFQKDGEKINDKHIDHSIKSSLNEVAVMGFQKQYLSIQRMLQTFEVLSRRSAFEHLRPYCTVKSSPRTWWRYAVNIFRFRGLISRKVSFVQVHEVCAIRKKYIQTCMDCLASKSDLPPEIHAMDDGLEEQTAIFFRCFAHSQYLLKEEELNRNLDKSWYGWLTGSTKKAKEEELRKEYEQTLFKDLNKPQTAWSLCVVAVRGVAVGRSCRRSLL